MANDTLYSLAADVILAVHLGFVGFVVLGFVVIWIGYFLSWRFVRNFYFRLAHLLAMGFVVFEVYSGMACPLTTWENELRFLASGSYQYQQSFMQYWLHNILFYDISPLGFTILYTLFFAALVLTFYIVKPSLPARLASKKS